MAHTATLSCYGGQWIAYVLRDDLTPKSVLLEADGDNLTGTLGSSPNTITVTVENPCPDIVTPTPYVTVRNSCFCDGAIFGVGQEAVCSAPQIPVAGCKNLARFRVDLTCCTELDGWRGPGWYCVRNAGSDSPCFAVELVAADACNDTIEICSGPYATKDAARQVCPGTISCLDYAIPANLTAVVTGDYLAGTYELTYGGLTLGIGPPVWCSPLTVTHACEDEGFEAARRPTTRFRLQCGGAGSPASGLLFTLGSSDTDAASAACTASYLSLGHADLTLISASPFRAAGAGFFCGPNFPKPFSVEITE